VPFLNKIRDHLARHWVAWLIVALLAFCAFGCGFSRPLPRVSPSHWWMLFHWGHAHPHSAAVAPLAAPIDSAVCPPVEDQAPPVGWIYLIGSMLLILAIASVAAHVCLPLLPLPAKLTAGLIAGGLFAYVLAYIVSEWLKPLALGSLLLGLVAGGVYAFRWWRAHGAEPLP